ncbi:hypothetical protein SAMN05421858_2318 [Haladaptatus litoreus]|uniref:DUF8060 domain-containing protein n=1 Tax=Haladaptatus litoreus TaxID=553468 RepID=A0A1N7B3L9_9EURY|nr:hypothetical protein [Haladaptatus litoreus]SIR45970.1 hypothetical protein SAMN05421858_2318 [Haladaptatus litoreus]
MTETESTSTAIPEPASDQTARTDPKKANRGEQNHEKSNREKPNREKVQGYIYRGALVLLCFLAIVALFQFYMSALVVIRTFIADQYRPLFNAAFNLAVLLATGIGISYVVRKIE